MNGIGGKTIAEAQERISVGEYQTWVKFRNRTGGLNPLLRAEWGAALISSVLANVNKSSKIPPFRVTDFAPNLSTADHEQGISIEQAKKEWL